MKNITIKLEENMESLESIERFEVIELEEKDNESVVIDNKTKLMWQRYSIKEFNWYDARNYAKNLNYYGYGDWRLPTVEELISIVDYSKYRPAINVIVFPKTLSDRFWSSSSYMFRWGFAWVVYFDDGSVFNYNKDYNSAVRCVRNILGD